MFLKINFQNNTKKVKFHEKYQEFLEFKKLIQEITETEFENLCIEFKDAEDDLIAITDSHDLEYFID